MRFITYSKFSLLAILAILFTACGDDPDIPADEKIKLTVQATAPAEDDKVADYSTFEVTISSERDGSKQTGKLSQAGTAEFSLDKGSYGIEISGSADGKDFSGTTGIVQYSEDKTVNVEVRHIVKQYSGTMDGIVLKEIFYNGGTYAGKMQHPDQYVVIANNSDKEIFVDGLVIAQSSRMNSLPCETLTELLPDYVAVANMYQIPGDGKTYGLKPGEVYVIASSALNHAELYEKNPEKDTGIPADLSGADFELADEDARMDGKVTDNPEVPNLIKISNNLPNGVTGWMHPYGIRPVFIFDGSGIDWDQFKQENEISYKEKAKVDAEIAEYHGYKVPTKLIIDGIETKSSTTPYWGNFVSKSLPETVDKGMIEATLGPSCHINSYLYRLSGADGKLIDTNDSSTDVKVEHRGNFEGFPKGWRNKQ
ncbi:DUF4876 domain-containing protein [uncultured Parabacteroides sp.]|uniref:DUF4876 domain-containing protein n=1 Tax=uncultured Parabacteroides sp. TaxID=512312 RepID=UPI002620D34F|nr:DUF4876 domain-containing protein [uncultured Parabacteroides sp.]